MYTGTDPSLLDLQTQITALTARLNSLDGVNLANPADGVIPTQQRVTAGIRQDLNQSILKMESILNDFKTTLNSWVQALQTHLGS
jgi:hypothetical protein